MSRLKAIISSVVGKKLIVALTGLVLLLFLVGHVVGNLKSFLGNTASGVPDIDVYAQFLKTAGEPAVPAGFVLWTARIVLLTALLLHVFLVIQLAVMNKNARPIQYAKNQTKVSSISSKWMMYTGIAILVFVFLHILHFTTGTIPLGKFEHGRVYSNLYHSFTHPLIALSYILAMGTVGLHLFHGAWSLFQTWGLDNPERNNAWRIAAKVFSFGLFAGFSLVPIVFMSQIMPEPPDYDSKLLHGHETVNQSAETENIQQAQLPDSIQPGSANFNQGEH